jgi:hypothetical protein
LVDKFFGFLIPLPGYPPFSEVSSVLIWVLLLPPSFQREKET